MSVFLALSLLEGALWAFWTQAVVAVVFVGPQGLQGLYTVRWGINGTAVAPWLQLVVPETAINS